MEIPPPSRIAILGAGPIGLEAALYARYLGYDVRVYERGRVGENLLRFGHVRLFSPFGMNRSPLALAALAAQDPAWRPPADDALLTAREYVEQYLLPLARSDLLDGVVHEQTEVVAVGRAGVRKGDLVGDAARGKRRFRLLLRDADGERTAKARVAIDATGTYGHANRLGMGGIPAVGERDAAPHIEYGLPDILGAERAKYAGRSVLVVGDGYSAATNVVALAQLADEDPRTHVTWIARREPPPGEGPLPAIPDDRLPERRRLAEAANRLAAGDRPRVTYRGGLWVDRVRHRPETGEFAVRLRGTAKEKLRVERIVANVGYHPDASLYEELHVHQCYASGGPMKLAAALAAARRDGATPEACTPGSTGDCLDQRSAGPEALLTTEPNFYILGAKSYGRDPRFLISVGLEQIRELFTLIGGREDLNLYATAAGRR